MKLQRLILTDFRNYQRCLWQPSASIAIFTGPNGSGKTNLLESLSLLSPGHGLRQAPYGHLPRHKSKKWGIYADLLRQKETSSQTYSLATGQESEQSKKRLFFLNHQILKYQTEVSHHYHALWLTPQMDRLFQENPSGRRRFLDRLTVSLYPEHLKHLAAYERSLSKRHRLLLEHPHETLWLDIVEESLARHAIALTINRMSFIENINLRSLEGTIFPKTLFSLSCLLADKLQKEPALTVEEWYRTKLKEQRGADRLKASTSFGAHRADFELFDQKTHRPAKFSSSGQQKIMLLGIILSHGYYLAQNWRTAPFILLDEPLTHLDETYRHAFQEILPFLKTSLFITGTDEKDFSHSRAHAEFISIENGILHSQTLRNASL